MVVVTLTVCPPALKGDLTLWLLEIDTGVYVGKVSSRVREELWLRITQNIGDGKATMVHRSNNEQGLEIKTYNTDYVPVDFDGLNLVMKPKKRKVTQRIDKNKKSTSSKISTIRKAKRFKTKSEIYAPGTFIVLDLETTGKNPVSHQIIEIAALKVKNGIVIDQINNLIKIEGRLPKKIIELTKITDEILEKEGQNLKLALEQLQVFCQDFPIVGYNISFDYNFTRVAFKKSNLQSMTNNLINVLDLVRKTGLPFADFSLKNVARGMEIERQPTHRAIEDCFTTLAVYLETIRLLNNN